jgi:hypothetical protein
MAQINNDLSTGNLLLSDSWSITATGSFAAPVFLSPGDEFVYSFLSLEQVESFKNFKYDYTGQTEIRYLQSFYRISRDQHSYSEWLPISDNILSLRNESNAYYNKDFRINNFPPFSSRDTLYFDLKFVRAGSSTIGTIKLLEYEARFSLDRNIADGLTPVTVTTSIEPLIIKPPFIYKIFRIDDVEILSNAQIETDFTVKYRFSQDYGRTVSDLNI